MAAPDRLWLADITEHPTSEGKIYCAAVMDAYSRRVIGWSIDKRQDTDLVVSGLAMAVSRRGPGANSTILHSDHGTQYTAWAFGKRLRDAGLLGSMGTIGDCYDNAMMCDDGVVLAYHATGTTRHPGLENPGRTSQRHIRVDRMLVQSLQAPFQYRNAQPYHV